MTAVPSLPNPRSPKVKLHIVATANSCKVQMSEDDITVTLNLRGRLFELLQVLAVAQLSAVAGNEYAGFLETSDLLDMLGGDPNSGDVARRIDRLRAKLAQAMLGDYRPGNSLVADFRNSIIETDPALGYRLSVPPENIRYVSIRR